MKFYFIIDPHFKTWHGEHFSYHGECDLVLVKNPTFGNNLGLIIHIRTKIENSWSYVKNVVIKVGQDVVEIEGRGEPWDTYANAIHYINGNIHAPLPFNLSEKHPLARIHQDHCNADRSNCVKAILYQIDFGSLGIVQVMQKFGVLQISVAAKNNTSFSESVGIMGHFNKLGYVARDGITTLADPNQFGQEWQVRSSEPMLFQERRAPQNPEQCTLPSFSTHRRLGEDSALLQRAREVCSKIHEEASKELCVYDVTASGRVEAASTYFTASHTTHQNFPTI